MNIRSGLSMIQQTLTAEAASMLTHSMAEASRRNHGQTTPLHVAAMLLASPTGYLRQACIRSHPNSSHPLQCRALELCFSVALERLPTAAQNTPAGMEPPISNALMAVLKRAQAHQRRGCLEQQQQPLLAVKVELQQLIISILDDPSVSRVMREASFSSPAVKATIEQSLHSTAGQVNPSTLSTGFRPNPTPIPIPSQNFCLNPRLQQGPQIGEEVKRIIDVLMRTKKRNPVLVGESEPKELVKELVRRIGKGELSEGPLNNVQVIQVEKEFLLDKMQITSKIKGLGDVVESRIGRGDVGIIIDLGDLKWLVGQQKAPVSFLGSGGGSGMMQPQVVSEVGRAVVTEMGNLLARFGENSSSNGKFWLVGTATCETYLRCQVYHPTMENDWDLQAMPIASRPTLSGMFPRLGANRIVSSSVDSVNSLKRFSTTSRRHIFENLDVAQRISCCPQCSRMYEEELAQLVAEFDKSFSQVNAEASRQSLPPWLQNAKTNSSNKSQTKEQELLFKQKCQELHRRLSDTCSRLHLNYQNPVSELNAPSALLMSGMHNPNLLLHQSINPELQATPNIGETLQLKSNQVLEHTDSPTRSPVRTDLVLGRTNVTKTTTKNAHEERVKDFLGCISQTRTNDLVESFKFANALDADSFKKLFKGLMEKVWWQPEAASSVTMTVTRCRLGYGKRRGVGSNGDMWLLFTGPDRVGKKKMASVLAEHVNGTSPIIICLGSWQHEKESYMNFRGTTVVDQIAEVVRRDPFSVIMLEDIDESDALIRGSIKSAMEWGRITDSHGREVSLGNVIFILAGNWSSIKNSGNGCLLDEQKLASIGSGGWQLQLNKGKKVSKCGAIGLHNEDRPTKHRKEVDSGLSLDLNLAVDMDDDRTDGSHNSSDITVDHEGDHGFENRQFSMTSPPHELLSSVDDTIVFKPVDFTAICREIENTVSNNFSSVIDDK